MKRYAVLGRKLGHSLSPLMHNMAFKERGIDAEYVGIEFEATAIEETIERLKDEKFSGFNITIPYKTDIIKYLTHLDDDAGRIGAVNTVKIENDNWTGYNTDVYGFLQPLLKLNKSFQSMAILGNGGAARAVTYALQKQYHPEQIFICARNEQKSNQIIKDYPKQNISHCNINMAIEVISQSDLIVNTTPLGMSPDTGSTPLKLTHKLRNNAVVYDLIYNPLQTRFLTEIKENNPGATIIGGLEMFVGQAAAAFRIWTGEEFPVGKVMDILRKHLSP